MPSKHVYVKNADLDLILKAEGAGGVLSEMLVAGVRQFLEKSRYQITRADTQEAIFDAKEVAQLSGLNATQLKQAEELGNWGEPKSGLYSLHQLIEFAISGEIVRAFGGKVTHYSIHTELIAKHCFARFFEAKEFDGALVLWSSASGDLSFQMLDAGSTSNEIDGGDVLRVVFCLGSFWKRYGVPAVELFQSKAGKTK